MLAERTFWEKATAMHVFCRQQRRRGERLSRHWYDLVRLDDASFAQTALGDRTLAQSVARHKAMFFREKDALECWIDYEAAVTGGVFKHSYQKSNGGRERNSIRDTQND